MSLRRQRRSQPQQATEIEWGNPIARGLSFAAVPIGPLFYDCVTRTYANNIGTIPQRRVIPNAGGLSREAAAIGAWMNTTFTTNRAEWPVSTTLRGAGMVQEGSILALAATETQVDGNWYVMGGNVENVTVGDGAALAIDSFENTGRGNILAVNYNGVRKSSSALLGNPFDNRLHFFGYGFSGNGTDGDFFAGGLSEAFTGGTALGTTTSNRQARVYHSGNSEVKRRQDSSVALLLFWDRRITPREYRALYENPWQLFAGVPERTRVRAPAALTPVLSAATVTSITATGATPRVTVTI